MAEDYNFDEAFKKQYKDYIDTGGFSKKMIKTYGAILLADIAFGWFVIPLSLWLGSNYWFNEQAVISLKEKELAQIRSKKIGFVLPIFPSSSKNKCFKECRITFGVCFATAKNKEGKG